jgi:hypothetical protein
MQIDALSSMLRCLSMSSRKDFVAESGHLALHLHRNTLLHRIFRH